MPASLALRLRRGSAAAWTAANPTLAAGEPALETGTGKLKIGDGVTAWSALAYATGTVQVVTGAAPPATPAVNIIWIDTSGA